MMLLSLRARGGAQGLAAPMCPVCQRTAPNGLEGLGLSLEGGFVQVIAVLYTLSQAFRLQKHDDPDHLLGLRRSLGPKLAREMR